MANKLACIGTEVNGIKEIIGDSQGGILFPKDDTQELTRCLEQLIHDDALKIELQKNPMHTSGRTITMNNTCISSWKHCSNPTEKHQGKADESTSQ
jgi:glycosyltransferase involved in cell wall biosynthesis